MTIDARKTQHIQQMVARSFAGRQRTIVVVYCSGTSYSYSAIQGIMRPQEVPDPQVFNVAGQPAPRTADTLLLVPLGISFAGAVAIADTTSATALAVAAAPKYEIVEVLPVGIIPGGSHLRLSLRRLR